MQVLKKLDIIRKNDIERILAERNILITVRNPFVVTVNSRPFSNITSTANCILRCITNEYMILLLQVRFFYSFTCRDNLYLVMEYLNGGDLYSLLRNVGCLEEDVARTYIAELVS